jgi:hypothetical protein
MFMARQKPGEGVDEAESVTAKLARQARAAVLRRVDGGQGLSRSRGGMSGNQANLMIAESEVMAASVQPVPLGEHIGPF